MISSEFWRLCANLNGFVRTLAKRSCVVCTALLESCLHPAMQQITKCHLYKIQFITMAICHSQTSPIGQASWIPWKAGDLSRKKLMIANVPDVRQGIRPLQACESSCMNACMPTCLAKYYTSFLYIMHFWRYIAFTKGEGWEEIEEEEKTSNGWRRTRSRPYRTEHFMHEQIIIKDSFLLSDMHACMSMPPWGVDLATPTWWQRSRTWLGLHHDGCFVGKFRHRSFLDVTHSCMHTLTKVCTACIYIYMCVCVWGWLCKACCVHGSVVF